MTLDHPRPLGRLLAVAIEQRKLQLGPALSPRNFIGILPPQIHDRPRIRYHFWQEVHLHDEYRPIVALHRGSDPAKHAVLRFYPESDYLIWTREDGCSGRGENCHAEAHYSRNNGRTWNLLDTYIRNCAWARDAALFTDPSEIICESYRDKTGNQKLFQMGNPLELIGGMDYCRRKKLFDRVVGFAKFSEFLIVAEVRRTLATVLRFPFTETSYLVPTTDTSPRYPGFFGWNELRDQFVPTNDANCSTRRFTLVGVWGPKSDI